MYGYWYRNKWWSNGWLFSLHFIHPLCLFPWTTYQMITIISRRRMRKSPSIMVLILVYTNQVTNIGKRLFLVSIYLSQYHNSSFWCSFSSLPDTFRYHRTLEILFLVKDLIIYIILKLIFKSTRKMKNRICYFIYIFIYTYISNIKFVYFFAPCTEGHSYKVWK